MLRLWTNLVAGRPGHLGLAPGVVVGEGVHQAHFQVPCPRRESWAVAADVPGLATGQTRQTRIHVSFISQQCVCDKLCVGRRCRRLPLPLFLPCFRRTAARKADGDEGVVRLDVVVGEAQVVFEPPHAFVLGRAQDHAVRVSAAELGVAALDDADAVASVHACKEERR